MQQQGSGKSVGGSALLWGIIFGIVVVGVDLVNRFVFGGLDRVGTAVNAATRTRRGRHPIATPHTPSLGYVLLTEGVILLVTLLLFFLAGALAARRARALEAGLSAGLIAGAIVGIAHLVVVFITVFTAAHATVGIDIVRGVVTAISALILGTGMGALGGLAGRGPRTSNAPPAIPYTPNQPPAVGNYAPMPPASTPYTPPAEYTPTPSNYGPQNDYPTAPLYTPPQP